MANARKKLRETLKGCGAGLLISGCLLIIIGVVGAIGHLVALAATDLLSAGDRQDQPHREPPVELYSASTEIQRQRREFLDQLQEAHLIFGLLTPATNPRLYVEPEFHRLPLRDKELYASVAHDYVYGTPEGATLNWKDHPNAVLPLYDYITAEKFGEYTPMGLNLDGDKMPRSD